ncbi:hypothetical protein AXF42_Ash010041 [Apostasia shenzhenica]|uniref:Uncharacterized protein n=1 Tax=Apostasia shenzhenica TaxID=1088818 RepID=A0A2I0ACN1_9ASPA|nr:hypothetical protein AXF42_Ash010041 [Apostasia shenzhenica]
MGLDQRVYNTPTSSQVAGILVEQTIDPPTKGPHIIVSSSSGQSYRIQHFYGCYDPLQYPLLFPYGDTGWHQGILKIENSNKSPYTRAKTMQFSTIEDILHTKETCKWCNLSMTIQPLFINI